MTDNNFDIEMMERALKEAQKAYDLGEVPVGAVLTQKGKILAQAHNQMERLKDPSAHAEILCIRLGAQGSGDWRLLDTTLYTTLEPCLMCAGALLLSRVSRVVYGAPDIRHGAHGSYLNVFETKHPTHTIEIEGGLLGAQSAKLLKNFFKQQRKVKEMNKEKKDQLEALFDELIDFQRRKLLKHATEIIPNITADDLLQPNDYPELENHPFFRYEEGVLKGLYSAKMAALSLY